ncbi:hypothetical protein FSP39_009677 [Pinctada imbricata]|uniref:Actin-related protein 2/3 complex subunit 5 n=1 Tax=Pinctada imbricata TaxID=66713 RepID=A0AA88XLP1_PINIB|nr:hypothetical protein FSP39_009677 [Pinctada imbricata]
MSKNTGSSKFRKVNVDEYDEEKFQEADEADNGVQGPNESEVVGFLNQYPFYKIQNQSNCKNVEALKAVLNNPPQGSKDQALKDRAVNLVVRVLTSFKSSEIENGVKALDDKSLDLLMKYIYRGFEFPSEGSSASLLTWHEKVYAKGGNGSIVRVLTDRKCV